METGWWSVCNKVKPNFERRYLFFLCEKKSKTIRKPKYNLRVIWEVISSSFEKNQRKGFFGIHCAVKNIDRLLASTKKWTTQYNVETFVVSGSFRKLVWRGWNEKTKNVLFFEKNCRGKVWLFFTKNFQAKQPAFEI